MKSHYLVGVIGVLLCGFVWVSADFAPPTALPPQGNVAPALNTGNSVQVKQGTLGIQLTTSPLDIPVGAGLYTDSTIGVDHSNYRTTNSNWKLDSSVYALDTNAPISVNGLYSSGPIRSESSIIAPTIVVQNLKLDNAAGGSRQLCARSDDGVVIPCTTAVGSQLQVSLSVTPASVLPRSTTPLKVAWQATSSASECTALQGAGFSTGGRIIGTDAVAAVTLDDGETAQFVVACSDTYGNTKIASAQVVAAQHAPIIALSVQPTTGGWLNGAFFTTGVSLDPNGGGSMNCKKKVDGLSVSPTNGWSGQAAGQWSSVISIPPGNTKSLNTCYDGCQFKDIIIQPESSALLTLQCSNDYATTTESKWISVGE